MQVAIPEAITNNGWQYYDKCRCGGVLQWKFRNSAKPMMELKWRVHYFQFVIIKGAKTIISPTNISKLDEVLKQL